MDRGHVREARVPTTHTLYNETGRAGPGATKLRLVTMCVESSSCLDLVEIRADLDRQERDPQSSTVSWNIP